MSAQVSRQDRKKRVVVKQTAGNENTSSARLAGAETLKRRKSQRLAGKKVLKERNGSQTAEGQAMRTSHEACSKGSSAPFAGLSVSPFSRGDAPLQSPTAADLLRASSPAFLGLTPAVGGLARPYSSERTPRQNGPFPFPAQQLFPPPRSPLPRDLNWANPDLLWEHLKSQDNHHLAPETDLKLRHPGLTATMRAILLDWMLEVCEVYRLHRESFYLAMDLYDRFLDSQHSIPKESLQKIGITCLFAAAKIEEIYPPKVKEFAYVTDGACTVEDILCQELIIYKALDWRLTSRFTVNNWVNTIMQLGDNVSRCCGLAPVFHNQKDANNEFILPKYSGQEFVQVMALLDLSVLDITSRQFAPSVLATSAMFLVLDSCRQHLKLFTGMEESDIRTCVNWLYPMHNSLRCNGPIQMKQFFGPPVVHFSDYHNIQTHVVNQDMLEHAQLQQRQLETAHCFLPTSSVMMTPPRTDKQHRALGELSYNILV